MSSTSRDAGRVTEHGWKPCERKKRILVEVFSVRFQNEHWHPSFAEEEKVYGFALLYPSGSGAHNHADLSLFKRKSQELPIINKGGYVKLTGPMHGVEVKDELAIHAYLWRVYAPVINIDYANTLWRPGVEETDRLICKEVETLFGSLEVSFAAYSDGVEAHVKVALVGWKAVDGVEVCGTVEAWNSRIPGLRARS